MAARVALLAPALALLLFAEGALAQQPAPRSGAGAPAPPATGDAKKDGDGKKKPEVTKPASETSTFDKVFAEDWFATARPTFEIHGYFRVRSELFANFHLGRHDDPTSSLWPRPASEDYSFEDPRTGERGANEVRLCGDNPLNPEPCESFTQAGANMRLRVEPIITVSDNIRAFAQIDLFDNIVLGSTPEGYVNQPGTGGGYEVRQRGGYTPIGAFAATQWAPTAGTNSVSDSIAVKRAWGEYVSPIGTFRFGRMPNHWGLGMVYNAGNGLDQDSGSTVDRLMFKTGLPQFDLYASASWDFADEGVSGGPYYGCSQDQAGCDESELDAQRYQLEAKRHDLIQSDDVSQWTLQAYRKRDPNLEKLDLAKGDVVVNGGFYGIYRNQGLESFAPLGANAREVSATLIRRGYEAFIPDIWGELKWKRFRVGVEAALIWGSIENTVVQNGNNFDNPDVQGEDDDGWKMRQFGVALESQFRAVEDRRRRRRGHQRLWSRRAVRRCSAARRPGRAAHQEPHLLHVPLSPGLSRRSDPVATDHWTRAERLLLQPRDRLRHPAQG